MSYLNGFFRVVPVTLGARVRASRPVVIAAVMAAALLAVSGRPASAQDVLPMRAPAGVSLAVAQIRPVGALGRNIGNGYGLEAALVLPLDRAGVLSFRADIGVSEYGNKSRRSAFSESVGGRVQVNVRTVNTIIPGSIGLQLAAPGGPIRPYVHTGVGAQLFYTESSVAPTSGGTLLASTVNQSDIAMAWSVGAGFLVPFRAGAVRVLLDLGARYSQGGRAEYMAPGGIVDLPDGQIAVSPMESTTNVVVVRLGARIGL